MLMLLEGMICCLSLSLSLSSYPAPVQHTMRGRRGILNSKEEEEADKIWMVRGGEISSIFLRGSTSFSFSL